MSLIAVVFRDTNQYQMMINVIPGISAHLISSPPSAIACILTLKWNDLKGQRFNPYWRGTVIWPRQVSLFN